MSSTSSTIIPIPRTENTLGFWLCTPLWYLIPFFLYTGNIQGQKLAAFKGAKSYLKGNVSADYNYYYKPAFSPLQGDKQASILLAGEYKWVKNKIKFTLQPHLRWDAYDRYRTHADLRNLYLSYWNKNFSLNAGMRLYTLGKFAGFSLVDQLNQRDFMEPILAFEKLGQPSIDAKYIYKKWSVEAYVMPYFRTIDFEAPESRLLLAPFELNADNESFDHEWEEFLPSLATRIGTKGKNSELVLGYFYGYNKNPDFVRVPNQNTFAASYLTLSQLSLEWQKLFKGFTINTETTHQTYKDNSTYWAFHGGIGYDLSKLYAGNSAMNLMVEYVYDKYRIDKNLPFGENFITLYTFNLGDLKDTNFSSMIFSNPELSYHFFDLKLSRRLFKNCKGTARYSFSLGALAPQDPLFINDFNTYMGLEMGWFF